MSWSEMVRHTCSNSSVLGRCGWPTLSSPAPCQCRWRLCRPWGWGVVRLMIPEIPPTWWLEPRDVGGWWGPHSRSCPQQYCPSFMILDSDLWISAKPPLVTTSKYTVTVETEILVRDPPQHWTGSRLLCCSSSSKQNDYKQPEITDK